jgi:hypothetical protein
MVVEKEPTAHNKTEESEQGAGRARGQPNPSWWARFKEYVANKSSFTDWCIVVFTAALTFVAIYQYFVTNSQLDVMRKDERAWVVVTDVDFKKLKFEVGEDLSVPLTITNIGKTPATNIRGDFYIELIPNGAVPHFESPVLVRMTTSVGLLIPNAKMTIVAERANQGINPAKPDPEPVTDAEIADYNAGGSWIAEHGALTYQDAFGVLHFTRQCTWDGSSGKLLQAQNCTAYNSTDNQ